MAQLLVQHLGQGMAPGTRHLIGGTGMFQLPRSEHSLMDDPFATAKAASTRKFHNREGGWADFRPAHQVTVREALV